MLHPGRVGGIAAIEGMQQAWHDAGRAPGDLYATAWMCGCVLHRASRPTARARWRRPGPRAATLLHRAADVDQQGWDNTMKVAEEGIAEAVAGYVEMAAGFEPQDARYLFNHRGHFVFVKPRERRFVTAELIRSTTSPRPRQELRHAGRRVARRRLNQLVIPITPARRARSTIGPASATRFIKLRRAERRSNLHPWSACRREIAFAIARNDTSGDDRWRITRAASRTPI